MLRPHDVLGLGDRPSPLEVRAAFRRFVHLHHPDRGGDPARFQAGVDAYRRLTGRPAGTGSRDVVFHRRPRGLDALTALWRARRQRHRRPARIV